MAVPFLVTMTLLALIPLAVVLTDTGPGTARMPLYQVVAVFGTLFASIPTSILVGGILGLRRRSRADI